MVARMRHRRHPVAPLRHVTGRAIPPRRHVPPAGPATATCTRPADLARATWNSQGRPLAGAAVPPRPGLRQACAGLAAPTGRNAHARVPLRTRPGMEMPRGPGAPVFTPASRPQAAKLPPSHVHTAQVRPEAAMRHPRVALRRANPWRWEFRPLRGRCRSETGAPLPSALRADCIFTPTGVPRTSRPHPPERLRTRNRLQRHVPAAGPAIHHDLS